MLVSLCSGGASSWPNPVAQLTTSASANRASGRKRRSLGWIIDGGGKEMDGSGNGDVFVRFAQSIGPLLRRGNRGPILIEKSHGAQIIFESAGKISFGFLGLP